MMNATPTPENTNATELEIEMDDDLRHRLDAHRAAFFALALVMDEAKPGLFENVIECLATLEAEAERRGEPAPFVAELREIGAALGSQHGDRDTTAPSPVSDRAPS